MKSVSSFSSIDIVLTISMNTMENKYLYYVNNINYIFCLPKVSKKKVSFELRHLWGCVFLIQRILRNGRLYHAYS